MLYFNTERNGLRLKSKGKRKKKTNMFLLLETATYVNSRQGPAHLQFSDFVTLRRRADNSGLKLSSAFPQSGFCQHFGGELIVLSSIILNLFPLSYQELFQVPQTKSLRDSEFWNINDSEVGSWNWLSDPVLFENITTPLWRELRARRPGLAYNQRQRNAH